jgi:hypothetical protein
MPLWNEFLDIIKGKPAKAPDVPAPKTWSPQQHEALSEPDWDFLKQHGIAPPPPGVTRVVITPKPAQAPILQAQTGPSAVEKQKAAGIKPALPMPKYDPSTQINSNQQAYLAKLPKPLKQLHVDSMQKGLDPQTSFILLQHHLKGEMLKGKPVKLFDPGQDYTKPTLPTIPTPKQQPLTPEQQAKYDSWDFSTKQIFKNYIQEGKSPKGAYAWTVAALRAAHKQPKSPPGAPLPALLPPAEREKARIKGGYTTKAYRGDVSSMGLNLGDEPSLGIMYKSSTGTDPQSGSKIYATDEPRIASLYAGASGIHDKDLKKGGVIQPLWIDTRDFYVYDAKGGQMSHHYDKAKQQAIKEGKKGVVYKNVQDAPSLGKKTLPSTVYVAFPGHNTVKSISARAFDPKDPRWLAGVTGIGVIGATGAGMLNDKAQASPADLPRILRAWHAGSPDLPLGRGTLDLTRAGSGESAVTRAGLHPRGREPPRGSQAGLQQGHAAYLAQSEGVADYYHNLLTRAGKPAAKYGGDLTVDPEHWIDFDKPFEQQSRFVRNAILRVYRSPQDLVRPSREKTEALKRLGVHGVRYLDKRSREGRGDTRNFALFEPKLYRITDKYGLAAVIGGGLAAAALVPGRAQAADSGHDIVNQVLGEHGFSTSGGDLVNQVLGPATPLPRSYLSRFADIPGDIAGVFREGIGSIREGAAGVPTDVAPPTAEQLGPGQLQIGTDRHGNPIYANPARGGGQAQAVQDFFGILGGAAQAAGSWALGPFRSLASRPLEEAGGPTKEHTEMAAGLFLPIVPRLGKLPVPGRPGKLVTATADDLFRLRQSVAADRSMAMEWIKQIPPQWKDAATQERWYHAVEENTVGALPAAEQQAIKQYLEPIRDKLHSLHAYIVHHDPNLGHLTDPTYIHRIAKTHAPAYDLPGTSADPVTGVGGTLPRKTSALFERKFLAIRDPATGHRTVITPGEGEFTAWTSKKPTHGIKTPDDIKPGNTIHVAGKPYEVVQATTREIEQHGLFADNVPAAYHKNAMVNTMDAFVRVNQVARDIDYLENLKKSPEWATHATTSKEKAHSLGWKRSKLPQLEEWYIEPKLREAFDDFYRPGAGDSELWTAIQKVNQFATTSLFWNPTPHIENVAAHWFVGRGWDWVRNPLFRGTLRALKAVTTQNRDYRDLLREGSGLVFGGVANRDFYRAMARRMGMEIERDPKRWGPVVRAMGLNRPADMVGLLYEGSRRALWWANDVFMLQRVFELERRGFSRREAIREAEKHIPNYRVPTRVLGSRAFSQAMADPALTMFGRYHYGMWNSFAHMVHGLTRGTARERFETTGNLLALFALAAVVYPMVSAGVKRLTGDPDAEKLWRGPLAVPGNLAEFYQQGDLAKLIGSSVTIAPGLKSLGETIFNRDTFTGRQIMEPGDWQEGRYGRVAAQEAEHAAGLVAPYGQVSQALQPGGRGLGRAMVDQVLGLKNVSDRTQRGKVKAVKAQRRSARQRAKHPRGLIERGIYEGSE